MGVLRKIVCWLFAISSFLWLPALSMAIVELIQRKAPAHWQGVLEYVWIFAVGISSGMAWWTVWKWKATGRRWALAASVGNLLLWAPMACYGWSYFWTAQKELWVPSALGALGILAFAPRYDARPPSQVRFKQQGKVALPDDGTSTWVNRSIWLVMIVVVCLALNFMHEWVSRRGLRTDYSSALVVVLPLIFAIVIFHELGHAVAGLIYGMKLHGFQVGPLRWQIVEGNWKFTFRAKGIWGGGSTNVIPTSSGFPSRNYIWVIAAGPIANLCTGAAALWVSASCKGNSEFQLWGALAEFATLSLILGTANLIPVRVDSGYSDGAQICQMFSKGPWADYRRVDLEAGSTLESHFRPRDYNISTIERAAVKITQGRQGLALRLYAFHCFLDRGLLAEARAVMKDAEIIAQDLDPRTLTEIYPELVFGTAFVNRDADGARHWWEQMQAKKPKRSTSEYWRASSALHWIEGDRELAQEAWEKGDAIAKQLPDAGAYDFLRHCYSMMHEVLSGETVVESVSS